MSEIKELEESSIFIDVNDSATQNINYNNCENYKNITFDMLNLSGVGRFLNVNTTIKKFALINKLLLDLNCTKLQTEVKL